MHAFQKLKIIMACKLSEPSHTIEHNEERNKLEHKTPIEINGAKLLGDFASGTSEWHEVRAEGIGGSEVGTILGLNPYESPFALWAKKTGQIQQEPLNNWAVRFGQKFEQPILELFEEEHPELTVWTTGTYASATTPYLHANPDAIAEDANGNLYIVEVKTSRNFWDVVPPAYIAQVRHYMNIFNIDRAVIVGVVGMTWVEHWVERDKFEEDVMLQKLAEFWQLVQTETAPDFDGATSTYEAVRKMHPDIEDTEVEIDGLHYLANAQAAYDEALANLNKEKSAVLALMGNAKHAYMEVKGQKYRVASRQAKRDGAPYLIVRR